MNKVINCSKKTLYLMLHLYKSLVVRQKKRRIIFYLQNTVAVGIKELQSNTEADLQGVEFSLTHCMTILYPHVFRRCRNGT